MCAVNSGCYCKQLQKAYSHPINILINPTWPQTADKPHVIAIKKSTNTMPLSCITNENTTVKVS